MKEPLELRMYFFVPYSLSDIQKGIQAGHAAMEYAVKYGNTKLFKDFVKNHKTWIILNGGVTRKDPKVIWKREGLGLIKHLLDISKIPYACFREPDLNDALTAICFIADERVFDIEKYPDFSVDEMEYVTAGHTYREWLESIGGTHNHTMREIIKDKRLA